MRSRRATASSATATRCCCHARHRGPPEPATGPSAGIGQPAGGEQLGPDMPGQDGVDTAVAQQAFQRRLQTLPVGHADAAGGHDEAALDLVLGGPVQQRDRRRHAGFQAGHVEGVAEDQVHPAGDQHAVGSLKAGHLVHPVLGPHLVEKRVNALTMPKALDHGHPARAVGQEVGQRGPLLGLCRAHHGPVAAAEVGPELGDPFPLGGGDARRRDLQRAPGQLVPDACARVDDGAELAARALGQGIDQVLVHTLALALGIAIEQPTEVVQGHREGAASRLSGAGRRGQP
mmetsp:Transcript_25474/g.46242  ORF Transcript_25474/g.46242 Transcript_25474/m.46242 type:complete len:288 (-) Transcript_25474:102-965(-)